MSTQPIAVLRLPHAADLPLPAYATAGSAGLDLCAALPAASVLVIEPGAREIVPTGLCLELPPGWEAQVRPRSGLALRSGVTVLNAPGTIDSDYRGEVKVILINHGDGPFEVRRGSRIAQIVFARVEAVQWREVPELDATARHGGGFGSTGSDARDG